jgi:hypothetical protein
MEQLKQSEIVSLSTQLNVLSQLAHIQPSDQRIQMHLHSMTSTQLFASHGPNSSIAINMTTPISLVACLSAYGQTQTISQQTNEYKTTETQGW